jgi:hypothetical protein
MNGWKDRAIVRIAEEFLDPGFCSMPKFQHNSAITVIFIVLR